MKRDITDYLSNFNYDNVKDTELLGEILVKALELSNLMKSLRDKYRLAGELPLKSYHSEYSNMQYISELINEEFMKFGQPSKVCTTCFPMTKEEIDEIISDPLALATSDLKSWVEEGLIKK